MSDPFDFRLEQAAKMFRRFCVEEQRHRVAWLIGDPRSGKSTLAQRLAEQQQWSYINYTLDPGYFDQLADSIQTYQPDEFITAIKRWCEQCSHPVLILDEIDSLLATWSSEQRRTWASGASRLRDLSCGLVLSTSFFDEHTLHSYLPNASRPHIFTLPGVLQ
jgi:hypothetical protein